MIEAMKRWLAGGEEPPAQEAPDAPLAAAALLVQAALSDGVYAEVEEERILAILSANYGLDLEKAKHLLADGEDLAEAAADHHQFTKILKYLPKDDRMALMTGLWEVALADGEKDAHEDALMRRLGPLLALSDRERAEARQAAQSKN